jgi:hypothetical protein
VGLQPTVLTHKGSGSEVDFQDGLLCNLGLHEAILDALIEALIDQEPGISSGLEDCARQVTWPVGTRLPKFKPSDDLGVDCEGLVPLSISFSEVAEAILEGACEVNDLLELGLMGHPHLLDLPVDDVSREENFEMAASAPVDGVLEKLLPLNSELLDLGAVRGCKFSLAFATSTVLDLLVEGKVVVT